MSRLRSATLLAATILTAAGCATPPPGVTLGSKPLAASAPAPAALVAAPVVAAQAPTQRDVVLSPSAAAKVSLIAADGTTKTTELTGEQAETLLSDMGGRAIDPQEADAERVAAELAALEAPPAITRLATAYTASKRTDAAGVEIQTSYETDPVWLTPRYMPVILPGSPSVLPAFNPRQLDTSKLPTEAFAELDRLRRLREAKDTWLPWLFGKKFLAIDAQLAKQRLSNGEGIFIGPDGSRWHRDKSFKAIAEAAEIDAMLPQLREDALTDQARTIRLANIKDRATLLPSFNRNYDVVKLLILDLIADDYALGGQPIRRGIISAANFLEIAAVRTAIATWWEDHPTATAAELRLATNRVLVEKFLDIGRRAESIAGDPEWYTEGQMIPGLRDPRPRTAEDDWGYKTDVAYNRTIILQLSRTMPAVLGSSLYQ